MSNALFSSTAPAGWNLLPLDTKQQFYNIASKGEWTAQEAFVHLVPEPLRDDPSQVELFMDGGIINIPADPWVTQGRGADVPDTYEVSIPDKDVSRIVSGENGGTYSTDNTVMEDMSINRARGAADMTESELQSVVESNMAEVDLIESAVESVDTVVTTGVEAAPTLLESVGGAALEALTPALVSGKVAKTIADNCDTVEDKVGYGALGALGTTLLYVNPVTGPAMYFGTGCWAVWKLGKFMNRRFGLI